MWTTAFLRYIAIYTEEYPGEIQQMLKYCEIIRDLAQRKIGLAWSNYDQNFRLLRENIPIPWDRIHTEFWIKAATATVPDPSRQQSKPFRAQQDTRPKCLDRTCWKFNKRGHCGIQTCKFDHKCGFCRGNQMLKYCEIIRDLAQRKIGLAWSNYDQNFRLLRENIPIPWDRIHTEFWIKAATATVPDPSRQQSKPFRAKQDTRPKCLDRTCWKFNKRGHCGIQTCKFDHKCGFCRGNHSAIRCTQHSKPDKPSNPNGTLSQPPTTGGHNRQPNRPNT